MPASYQRSDGEVGGLPSDGTSVGELRFPDNKRFERKGNDGRDQGRSAALKQRPSGAVSQHDPSLNKELSATYNYEEDKDINEGEIEKPVYDSSEGPVPKGARGRPQKGTDVFVSGESFGPSLIGPRGGKNVDGPRFQKRETIGENFLEEDNNSSGLEESGEIDPKLFK